MKPDGNDHTWTSGTPTPPRPLGEARNLFAPLRHRLRTEIDQILGYSQLLQDELATLDREDLLNDLDRIESSGARLMSLVDGLLDPYSSTPHAGPGPDPVETATSRHSEPAENSARILVVDDNEMNRDLLLRRLRQQGCEAESATGGRECLQLLSSSDYDLVLLDVMMPGINGLEVLETIRRDRSPTELPVIMVTAQSDSQDVVRALQAGANDFVPKPIDFAVAMARIRTQLALKRASDVSTRLAQQLELRNRMIRRVFGRYLTDDVVSSLLELPGGLQLGGEQRRLTILMADLRGFTTLSENLPPEQIVRLLNVYLAAMAEVITQHGGTIDEFIGDAILVLFGAPLPVADHARSAVACALRMQEAMSEVNRHIREQGLPEVQIGIGINTGEVVVGNIGSERRTKYGVVGHHVNLTARIESQTLGGQILISEETQKEIGDGVQVGRQLQVALKGLEGSVRLFEVRGLIDTAASSPTATEPKPNTKRGPR